VWRLDVGAINIREVMFLPQSVENGKGTRQA